MKSLFIPVLIVSFIILIIIAMIKLNTQPKMKVADSLSRAKDSITSIKADSITKNAPKVVEQPTINYDAQALSEVKREPKVKEALLNGTILYVSVVSDGSDRSGYADYICEVVRNSKIERVKVVEYGSTNNPNKDNAYGVLLGSSKCK